MTAPISTVLGSFSIKCAAGRLPLVAKTIPEQLICNICRQPVPLHQRNPNIPLPLSQLIHRLIDKEPRNRPRSALELERLVDDVARQCTTESQAALRIVTEPDTKPTAAPLADEATVSRLPPKSIGIAAGALAASLLMAGLAWWATGTDNASMTNPDSSDPLIPTILGTVTE